MRLKMKKSLLLITSFMLLSSLLFAQESDISTPKDFYLEQNYPNPFNPSTTIRFSIPSVGAYRNTPVLLKIYNVLGNEIATIVNEELPVGNYNVEYDASNLPSGIYFYTLTTNDFSETKKMTLVK
jgi:hypothetical protein